MPATDRDRRRLAEALARLRAQAAEVSSEREAREILARTAQLTRAYKARYRIGVPATLLDQAVELDPRYRRRPHLTYLSDRLARAVADVEAGRNRMIAVSMPPRSGKSTLLSLYGPVWLLRMHPEWEIVTASHDPALAVKWAGGVRERIEQNPDLGIVLKRDGGAAGYWETVEGGGLYAVGVRGSLTGRGAKIMIIDDPVKDFAEAHSQTVRQALWDWWRSVAFLRLEAPYLVLVVMTRWHEDDFVGRLFSPDHEGDPADWERISVPALAEDDDVLGRLPGQPLLSPLSDEDEAGALSRTYSIRTNVGTYVFAAMHQQRPSPAKGAIFDTGWWRFWTRFPERATKDGLVVYLDPGTLTGGRWLDSWDASFDSAGATSSWVVGQRWVRSGPDRYLIAQRRGRWSFTETLAEMLEWAETGDPMGSPCGHLVHQRLVEKKANGAAIIDVLKRKFSGIKPITPKESKTARARSVTPECESHNVFLPYPGDPGNEWVHDFLAEVRDFPNGTADDQVDGMTQALAEFRDETGGKVSVPGNVMVNGKVMEVTRDLTNREALTSLRRQITPGPGRRIR